MKKLFNSLIFGLLFLWQLPQNIVALLWLAFAGKKKVVAYRNYCVAVCAKAGAAPRAVLPQAGTAARKSWNPQYGRPARGG